MGLAVLTVLVYLNSLHNPFVYDDYLTVVENPSIRAPLNLKGALLHMRFRPVVNLSYALDYSLWELDSLGYHLTGLWLHTLNVILFFSLVLGLLRDWRERYGGQDTRGPRGEMEVRDPSAAAFAASALFALHPLMTQAVGYTSGRAELLVTASFLAAFLAMRRWFRNGGGVWLSTALFFFALSLATKENAVAFPFLVLAYDRWLAPAPAGATHGRTPRRRWLHGSLITLVLVSGTVRLSSLLMAETPTLPRTVWENLLSQTVIVWRYLFLMLAPVSQSLVHPTQRAIGLLDGDVLLAGAGLLGLVGLAFALRRRAPLSALGIVWFLLALAPSSTLIPLNELMAEHRVYLASLGIFLVTAEGAARLGHGTVGAGAGLRRYLPAAGLAAVLVVLASLTVMRNRVWSDPVTLWQDASQKAPKTWAAFFFLGEALRLQDRCEEAIATYRTAARLLPEEPETYFKMGSCLARSKRYDEAFEAFSTVLELDPHSTRAGNDLGRLAATRGRFAQARAYFENTLKADPHNQDALYNMALLHERVYGDSAEALRLCRQIQAQGAGVPAAVVDCIHRNEAQVAGGSR